MAALTHLTPKNDPTCDTDKDDPGHLLPQDCWDKVVADAEADQ